MSAVIVPQGFGGGTYRLDFVMSQGDDLILELTARDRQGNIVVIANFSFVFAFYESPLAKAEGEAPLFQKTTEITIVDAAQGRFNVPIDMDDTKDLPVKNYYWEVQSTNVSVGKSMVSIRGVARLDVGRIAAA